MTQTNFGGTNHQIQTGPNNTNFYDGVHHHHYPPTPDEIVGVPQNLPFSGTAKFVGRDAVLVQVREQLAAGQRLAITAIQGMGGIGKTELALQYALKFSEDYAGGICWLRAREEIATQIVDFGRSRLNLRIPDELDDIRQQVPWCWQHWRSGQVLLVLDDVVDYRRVKAWLPQNDGRFQVLLTTREKLGAGVMPLELEVLRDRAALELLESLVGLERLMAEQDAAQALCAWVGNLPLGLELVGRYLAGKVDLALAEMVRRLEAKRLEAPAMQAATPEMTAQRGVKEAFELSWVELSPLARELAGLLSLFALAPIPWQLPSACLFDQDEEELEDARDQQLVFLHLLQHVGVGKYQLHPLVREFFADKLKSENLEERIQKICQRFARSMTEVAKIFYGTPRILTISIVARVNEVNSEIPIEILERMEFIIPHLSEAAQYVALLTNENDRGWVFIALALFYEKTDLFQEAAVWYTKYLDFSVGQFGDQHPSTASSLVNLAAVYRSMGAYERALSLYEQALKIRQFINSRDADMAAVLGSLGALCYEMESYGRALLFYEQELEVMQSRLGDQHPDIADALIDLALNYRLAGQYERALSLYEQALKIGQLIQEPWYILDCLENLAILHNNMRQFDLALSFLQQALKISQQEGFYTESIQKHLDNVRQNMEGGFKPILRQEPFNAPRLLPGLENKIIGLHLRGLDIHEIRVQLIECHGVEISGDLISEVTDEQWKLGQIIIDLYDDEGLGVRGISSALVARYGLDVSADIITTHLAENHQHYGKKIASGWVCDYLIVRLYNGGKDVRKISSYVAEKVEIEISADLISEVANVLSSQRLLLPELEDEIISLYLRGLDVHKIREELFMNGRGEILTDLISEVTDKALRLDEITPFPP
jgi:tetratricopeptide (TPR) repeat protein